MVQRNIFTEIQAQVSLLTNVSVSETFVFCVCSN